VILLQYLSCSLTPGIETDKKHLYDITNLQNIQSYEMGFFQPRTLEMSKSNLRKS
jgi:hypothetical protein